MKYTIGSFFAGVGGIDLGFEQTNHFEVVYANEIDPYPAETYNLNFRNKVDVRDINIVKGNEIPDFDVMVGGFPCLTGDTLVLTNNGYKEIINVKPGDMVVSHDSEMHEVLNFMNQGIKNVYEIKATGILDIKATNNHRFYVSKKLRKWNNSKRCYDISLSKPEWKSIEDIQKSNEKYYLGCPINDKSQFPNWDGIEIYINQSQKKKIKNIDVTSDDFWYIVGRYLGDGWLRKQYKEGSKRNNYSGIIICCNKNETEYLKNKINNIFKYTVSNENTVDKIHICSAELGEFMSQFGEYAIGKYLPSFVYDLPIHSLKKLITGYFEADGSFEKDNKHKRITSINCGLLYGFMYCIQKAYRTPCLIRKGGKKGKTYIQGREVNIKDNYILTYTETPIYRQNGIVQDNYVWHPIKSIELIGKENVYDIEVKDTHSFIANNCVTHNCQAFSVAGYRQGFDDEKGRGTLFFELCRIIKEKKELGHQPKVVFFENVKNLVGHDNGNTFKIILEMLNDLGYKVEQKVLNACEYGDVPQNRERIYIVGFLDESSYNRFKMPLPIPLTKKIGDCIDFVNKKESKYYYTEKCPFYDKLVEGITKSDTIYQWRRIYVRENKSNVCPTLTANMGTGGHNVPLILTESDQSIRKLTPRECFNLQGFPQNFKLPEEMANTRLYKQAGNSVVVPVIKRIADNIYKAIM